MKESRYSRWAFADAAAEHFRKEAARIDKLPNRVRAKFWAEAVDLVNRVRWENGAFEGAPGWNRKCPSDHPDPARSQDAAS